MTRFNLIITDRDADGDGFEYNNVTAYRCLGTSHQVTLADNRRLTWQGDFILEQVREEEPNNE